MNCVRFLHSLLFPGNASSLEDGRAWEAESHQTAEAFCKQVLPQLQRFLEPLDVLTPARWTAKFDYAIDEILSNLYVHDVLGLDGPERNRCFKESKLPPADEELLLSRIQAARGAQARLEVVAFVGADNETVSLEVRAYLSRPFPNFLEMWESKVGPNAVCDTESTSGRGLLMISALFKEVRHEVTEEFPGVLVFVLTMKRRKSMPESQPC